MTLKEILLQEIEGLPEERQVSVLAFVRFLKIGLADTEVLADRFAASLAEARRLAADGGIAEADIERKIEAVRTGQPGAS